MHVPLVLGDNPLAKRIAYYLNKWGEQRGEPTAVVTMAEGGGDIDELMKTVFLLYTGKGGVGRVTSIVNAHELEAPRSETAPNHAFAENSMAAAQVALAARAASIPLVQISSAEVFGATGVLANTIEHLPKPSTVYGLSLYEAEQAVLSLHPSTETTIGACVVRLGPLYGFDVDTWPASVATFDRKVQSAVLVPDNMVTSPCFIGEAAFLIARNLLESPNLLRRGLVHCAPGREPQSWYSFLEPLLMGGRINPLKTRGPGPENTSLAPTQGWFLPNDAAKSWRDFSEELESQKYLRYWKE